MAEQILSSYELKKIEEKKAYVESVAAKERKVNAGEKVVPANQSKELQDAGAEVVAMFEVNGKKMHKVKLKSSGKKDAEESKG